MLTEQPLVSIIIPTYNRAHLIGETLDSVLVQTYTNWECIVVDDGSTDNTDEVVGDYLAKDQRFKYYHRPPEHLQGGNGARNFGFKMSHGEYIQWFDDDDLMLTEYLAEKSKLLTENENLYLSICTGYKVDEALNGKEIISLIQPTNVFKDFVFIKFKVLTPSVLFRYSFLNGIDLFNENLVRGQEEEFFSRVFFQFDKQKLSIINKSLYLYRQHKVSKTVNDKAYNFDYKASQTYIYQENLERSIFLKDEDLIKNFYWKLLKLFFQGIQHKHKDNSREILYHLHQQMSGINTWLAFEIQLLGFLSLLFNRPFYHFHLRLKNHKTLSRI